MANDFTLGYWNHKEEKFDVFAKIHDPHQEGSALAIYAPKDGQDVLNMLSVMLGKGLLKLDEYGRYVVTPEGERYHNALQRTLGIPQQEEHDEP